MRTLSKVIRASSCLLLVCGQVFTAAGQTFQSVSVSDPAQQPLGGSGDSGASIISPDGRYVLFASTANNLDGVSSQLFPIIPPRVNVFLRDRTTGVTTLVSANVNGTAGGNGDSLPADVSTNGRYAVFESSASDLFAGDTNNATDVFVRDLQTGTTLLVSAATNGLPGNGDSRSPAMTPDGRYVAFVSAANNLVAGDVNGIGDVFVRDMQTGVTTLVSIGAQSRNLANPIIVSTSDAPSITPDGRYVLFLSEATNLVTGVPSGCDIYMRDVVGAQTTWVSSYAATALQSVSARCFNPSMSADGRYVVYGAATNTATRGLVLYADLQMSQTVVVHTNAAVARMAYEDIRSIEITADGRFVAFVANTNSTSGVQTCICVWDSQTGTLEVPSLDLSSQVPTNSVCNAPGFDAGGRFVVFMSNGSNLVTNSMAAGFHAYLRDRQLGTTTLLDADTNGVGTALSQSVVPRLSGNGKLVAFECPDGNLFPNDRNRNSDLVVHDLDNGTNDLISVRPAHLFTQTPNGPSSVSSSSVSSNGLLVAFLSEADNLVTASDTNSRPDIFVRDLAAGTNLLVSVDTNGLPSDGASYEPAISADGRYVAFMSSGDNLVSNDTNKFFDIFRRDLLTGSTALVSVNTTGTKSALGVSRSPIIAGNGRYVLFLSTATDIVPGLSLAENLFCRDMDLGKTFALTTNGVTAFSGSRDSTFIAVVVNSPIARFSVWNCASSSWVYSRLTNNFGLLKISPDGQRIAYNLIVGDGTIHALDWATATDRTIGAGGAPYGSQFSGDGNFFVYAVYASQAAVDTNGVLDVYLYDFQLGTNSLISRSYLGGAASGRSDYPDISSDGRFIAYRSVATNIVPQDTNGMSDVFVYDRLTQTATLLSASRLGNRSGNQISMAPFFSADGKTLLFESWASDLVPHDFNGTGDVFAYGLSSGSPIPIFYAKIFPDGGTGQGWWVTWPALPGNSYSVQYKNDLGDTWQDLPRNVTTLGGQGFLRDPGPSQTQRFYRVVAFEP